MREERSSWKFVCEICGRSEDGDDQGDFPPGFIVVTGSAEVAVGDGTYGGRDFNLSEDDCFCGVEHFLEHCGLKTTEEPKPAKKTASKVRPSKK